MSIVPGFLARQAGGLMRGRTLVPGVNMLLTNTVGEGNPSIGLDIATNPLLLGSGQINFPATQNPSSGANVFDDYEEGSWTPVIGGSGGTSGQTYTTQLGRYVKKGREVSVWFVATLSAKGTITTNVQIQGLPFTAENVTNLFGTAMFLFNALATNWVTVEGSIQPGTTIASVVGLPTAASTSNVPSNLVTADITNTTLIAATFQYRADN